MSDKPDYVHDTIVAAATPPGTGGIGIVRISGADVPRVAEAMLGGLPPARRATLKTFRDATGSAIDQGIALYFPAPGSFTGEPVLELHGHGGPVVVSLIVEAAVECGARRAQPGEFSKRAYLNDKLDLVQAEAVADLIGSGTAQAARAALRSLSGEFSAAVHALQARLVNLRLHVEAAIDFPEEEIDFLSDQELLVKVEACAGAFAELKQATRAGRLLRDGYQVVIVGRPNVGKSSLLNLLSGQEAAIVTEVAGTTRDVLRETIDMSGLLVELVDTAGLREDPDRIEAEGIRRARQAIASADAVLFIQDASDESTHSLAGVGEDLPDGIPVVAVRNKVDLTGEAAGRVQRVPPIVNVSAKTGAGTHSLREQILELAGHQGSGEGAFTARLRHVEALRRAEEHFASGRRALAEMKAGELFAEELRLAHAALGEITGQMTSDDLLGLIFSEFCIGK